VPLADDWTITVVPGIGMLARPASAAGTGLVSVGCANAGVAYGLPAVPELPPQAQRVARVLGTTALPEEEATPAGVARSLPGARYVHIATHASQLAYAPAFQCLYLTPGDDGEGRLFAHQIAGLDLRGVQLVTLCACESALGRFDAGDNLRGLSAAFLAAGASAVVAALWPVAAGPAAAFFSSLYQHIGPGCSAVSAFRAAQLATRQIHREYRDWGAFAFIGDWRV
jgi:CHAT domain-containing protein